MLAASRGHVRFQKIKNFFFENLNDAYIMLMPMIAICK